MTSPAFCFFLSLLVLVVTAFLHPDRGGCPDGWYVEFRGDRCDGCYECRPVDRGKRDPRGHELDEAARWPETHVDGWIHCTGGARSIVENERVVGCEARH